MKSCSLAVFVAVVVVLLVAPAVLGRPPHRQKRVSDQRLGELEALLALKKLRGKLVAVPIAYGQIDPNDYGRKRRSAPSSGHSSLIERVLEALPQDDMVALELNQDAYDDSEAAAGPAAQEANEESRHWAAYERDRPTPAFNRPVTE